MIIRTSVIQLNDFAEFDISYIATRCSRACVLVTYLLRNGWTDLAKLFFVSSVLVTGWF